MIRSSFLGELAPTVLSKRGELSFSGTRRARALRGNPKRNVGSLDALGRCPTSFIFSRNHFMLIDFTALNSLEVRRSFSNLQMVGIASPLKVNRT